MAGGSHAKGPTQAAAASMAAPRAGTSAFADAYRRHFHDCCRWLRAMGAPDAELEDLSQEVFLVVRRRIDEEPIENLAGWIYRIAFRTLSDHRRRAWWRNLVRRRGSLREVDAAASAEPGPDQVAAGREQARRAERLLDTLAPELRAAFVLFEVEGLSGLEIAALSGVPQKTVWTRLHRAREQLAARIEKEERRMMSKDVKR